MKRSKDTLTEEKTTAMETAEKNEENADNPEVANDLQPQKEQVSGNNMQSTMLDVPTAISTLIARTEATGIVVSVLNSVIDVLQKRDIALTQEELGKIQSTVNAETEKTDNLYKELEQVLRGSAAKEDTQEAPQVHENA